MANEIEIVIAATNQAAQTLSEAAAAARADGEAAGTAFAEGVDAGASKAQGAGAGMEKLGEEMAAQGAVAGEKAGAELANGVVAGTTSLEDRMRAGYDKVLASWTEGTAGFVDAQLQTFADYYGKLAALGDESAAAQLAAIRQLAGGTEGAVAEMGATVTSAADRMNAAFEAAMSRGGAASGEAFNASFAQALAGSQGGISDAAVTGFDTLLPEAAAVGTQAGARFGVSFSEGAQASLMNSSVSSIIGEEFSTAVSSIGPVAAGAGRVIGDEFSLSLQASIRLAMSTAGASAGGMDLGFSLLATDVEAAATALGDDFAISYSKSAQKGLSQATDRASFIAGGLPQALDETAAAADKAGNSMGAMASIMYGPLGYALFGLMSFAPMLSGMFTTASVSAANFTQSVSQDSLAVGDNTAVTIQAALAKQNLDGISKQLGLSQAQLIEYASGEADVQQKVVAAYEAKMKALEQSQQQSGRVTAGRSGANGTDPNGVDISQLASQKDALDAVTTAVAQAIQQDEANSAALLAAEQSTKIYNAAVNALGAAMLLQVQQTKMSNQATVEYSDRILTAMQSTGYFNAAVGAAGAKMLQGVETTKENNTAIVQYGTAVMGAYRDTATFNAALDASYVSMQISAQTSAQTSVGLLNMGDAQTSLNDQLVMAEDAYTQSTSGATAYGTALTALNGDTVTLLGSEAAFTTSLDGLTKSIKTNGDSLDVNTTKGAANITAIVGIANAADKAAVAVYQNEVNTVGSTKAYEDANTKLTQEKTAFENQAIAAGMSKDKVKQLADQLFQLPPSVDIPINANVQPALNSLAQVIGRINSSSGTVTVYETSGGTIGSTGSGGYKAYATGGITTAATGGPRDGWVQINEQGQEWARFPTGTTVIPRSNVNALSQNGAGSGYGGAPQLTLEIVGADAEMVQLMRKVIRVRGGNVQKVLGVN